MSAISNIGLTMAFSAGLIGLKRPVEIHRIRNPVGNQRITTTEQRQFVNPVHARASSFSYKLHG